MADGRKGKKYGLRHIKKDVQANQWQGTDQQEEFIRRYYDPESPTFANKYASAMEAGYAESYAKMLARSVAPVEWLKESNSLIKMSPEHTIQAFQQFALDPSKKDETRLRALELLAKAQGIFVERKQVLHANIDEALREFDED